MKNNNLKRTALVVAASVAVVGAVHFGATRMQGNAENTLGLLQATPVVEMPAVAASLVQKAKGVDRATAVQEVIKDTLALDRACTLPYVVSAICRQAPDMAAETVMCAVKSQPQDSVACLRSGVAAAPQQLDAIILAMVKEYPEAYAGIAYFAAQQLPEKASAILNAVGQAMPALQPHVQQALAQAGTSQIDVAQTLAQAAEASAAAASEAAVAAKTSVIASHVSALVLADTKKGQVAPVAQYVNAEVAKVVPQTKVTRSASSTKVPAVVLPATLKVPTPSEVKASSAELLPGGNRYARP